MKFLLYTCRHGDDTKLFPHTEEAFNHIVNGLMPACNGAQWWELENDGLDCNGCPDYHENARFSIDDGGRVYTIELMENFNE